MVLTKIVTRTSSAVVIGVLGLSLCLSAGCARKQKTASESIEDIQKREGIPVRVLTVNPDTLEAIEVASGTAEGDVQTTITAGMIGRIAAIRVKVGDNVAKDSSMMVIDPDVPQNYTTAKTQYENAEKMRSRVKALADQGGVSQEMLDQVEAGYTAAREGMQSVMKSQFVLAPFAGTVVNVFPELNSTVDFGKQLVTLAKIDRIRIPVYVSESSINRFKVGQKAFAVVGSDTLFGRVEKVAMAGNAVGHNFRVDVVFTNGARRLKPGMYVTVRVVVSNKPNVLALPMETIVSEGADKHVFTINNGIAKKAPVSVGIRGGDRYEILGGISSGEMVVTAGTSNLTDGAKVKIVD